MATSFSPRLVYVRALLYGTTSFSPRLVYVRALLYGTSATCGLLWPHGHEHPLEPIPDESAPLRIWRAASKLRPCSGLSALSQGACSHTRLHTPLGPPIMKRVSFIIPLLLSDVAKTQVFACRTTRPYCYGSPGDGGVRCRCASPITSFFD